MIASCLVWDLVFRWRNSLTSPWLLLLLFSDSARSRSSWGSRRGEGTEEWEGGEGGAHQHCDCCRALRRLFLSLIKGHVSLKVMSSLLELTRQLTLCNFYFYSFFCSMELNPFLVQWFVRFSQRKKTGNWKFCVDVRSRYIVYCIYKRKNRKIKW